MGTLSHAGMRDSGVHGLWHAKQQPLCSPGRGGGCCCGMLATTSGALLLAPRRPPCFGRSHALSETSRATSARQVVKLSHPQVATPPLRHQLSLGRV